MENHSRIIIHIDIDCFYAQVEMIKDPRLRDEPLGIQQKNCVVTSNYVARGYGVKKCISINEAKKLCPNLVLVNGEDLYDYRQISNKLTSLLHTFSELVEKLGLDENFIDVTNLVNEKLKSSKDMKPVGHKFGETNFLCDCGCTERINIGSQIAEEIRHQIYEELHLTTCAGIAHNKLLAKIAGSKNKPNKQTFVYPNDAVQLILSLELVINIPWIGQVSAEQLSKINITKVENLQDSNIEQLKNLFGFEKAEYMWNASYGIDNSPVKTTGKPLSIGLEDSCKAITSEKEVEDKLKWLLKRLMILIKEDGRIPKTIKLTIRKYNDTNPYMRETKQCNFNTSLENEGKIINIAMALFRKSVDIKKKFHITLLGLSFTKFEEKTSIKNTLTRFFSRDKEVNSVTHYIGCTSSLTQNINSSAQTGNKSEYSDSSNIKDTTSSLTESIPETGDKTIRCPPHLHEDVFRELPIDLQEELWNDYKRKREVDKIQRPRKKIKTNSILNYVVKQ